jgi:hypothetical protein
VSDGEEGGGRPADTGPDNHEAAWTGGIVSDLNETDEATAPEDDEDVETYIGEPLDGKYLERLSEEAS